MDGRVPHVTTCDNFLGASRQPLVASCNETTMKTGWIATWVTALGICGCGAAPGPEPRAPSAPSVRMAILPAQWVTPDPKPTSELTQAVLQGVRSNRGVEAQAASVPSGPAQDAIVCQDDPDCLRTTGERTQASKVVVTKIASLGGTVLVRMTVVDVKGGTQEQTRQSVSQTSESAALQRAVRALAAQLAKPYALPAPEQPSSPWYDQWWVWTVAGAVVTTSVAVPLMLREPDEEETPPDVVITPP